MGLKPRNWERFQHYKNRRPPWIKLHRSLIDDPDFWALKGEDAKYLMAIWIIASESESGELPVLAGLAFRLRIPLAKAQQLVSRLRAWIDSDDSGMLAKRKQLATPETEGETEERGEGERASALAPPDFATDPEEDIPEGLAPTQYANFVLEQASVPAGNGTLRKMADAISFLSRDEHCTQPQATKRMLDRVREAQRTGPVKIGFWLEERRWAQTQGVSTEGWE